MLKQLNCPFYCAIIHKITKNCKYSLASVYKGSLLIGSRMIENAFSLSSDTAKTIKESAIDEEGKAFVARELNKYFKLD